jgi:nickel-dependent lactate racemase
VGVTGGVLSRQAPPHAVLDDAAIEAAVAEAVAPLELSGRRVLVLVPDRTRTMPLPVFFRALTGALLQDARALDFLVALGTHRALSEAEMLQHFGLSAEEKAGRYAGVRLLNHAWDDPAALATIATLPADEIAELSSGLLRVDVPVRLNRLVLDYDHLLVCGPVFPHEVVGFSGGSKYFFPGIAGADLIDLTHWLGALITTHDVIGRKDTPVRRVVDRAASLIPTPASAICSVVTHAGVAGVFGGSLQAAWSAAADLSAERHVIACDRPFRQVLAVLPEMYRDLWVGAKGMYKTEPAVADGGEVILYAPHLREVSSTHGAVLRRIGYHVRDYFTSQWEAYRHLPWSVLAHSTHLRGGGTYEGGVERPRIQVTLATGIGADECRVLNLGYRDPATIDPAAFEGRESDGILCVRRAGEYLYKLR